MVDFGFWLWFRYAWPLSGEIVFLRLCGLCIANLEDLGFPAKNFFAFFLRVLGFLFVLRGDLKSVFSRKFSLITKGPTLPSYGDFRFDYLCVPP